MATDLGKVGIVMKGTWSSSATYEGLDAVSYNNGFYIAKQAVPANTLPTNTTYWQLALDGAAVQSLVNIAAPATGKILPNALADIPQGISWTSIGSAAGYSDAPTGFGGYSACIYIKRSYNTAIAFLVDRANMRIFMASSASETSWAPWYKIDFIAV